MDELLLVLLGLRSAPKEDLGCSPSELVYGTTIRLPGEFFETPTSSAEQDVSGFLALRPSRFLSFSGGNICHLVVEISLTKFREFLSFNKGNFTHLVEAISVI